uniref:Protocadherin 18a n=1 Tax=Nothobranchius pienaari TaxID=704102 RepID=A0A1A8MJB0_9TELE
MGRESPVDRLLLGEGFSDLMHLEMHHRLHPAMRLCTDECRILGHSDQCWMPPLASPTSSADYRNNMYIPGEESSQQPQLEDDQSSVDSENRKSFSTFGKESGSDELGAGGGGEVCAAGGGTGSLLTEMNSVFQRLLPPNMDSYTECTETSPPSSLSTTERGSCRSGNGNHSNSAVPQDNRRGLLPGGKVPAYPPGVAAWAASTHYLNPGSGSVGSNHLSSTSSSSSSSLSPSSPS